MTENTTTQVTEDTTPETRAFYRNQYETFAGWLRSARIGKTPAQLVSVNALTDAMVGALISDNPSFDPAPFYRAAQLRTETSQAEAFALWFATYEDAGEYEGADPATVAGLFYRPFNQAMQAAAYAAYQATQSPAPSAGTDGEDGTDDASELDLDADDTDE